ncbi:MAG: hypothetical protein HWD59_07220 [Coxiellaceae bacterium]|nr:MAG: hypothetical protein HWD59_07220 [Coxiellaceae bacterium]
MLCIIVSTSRDIFFYGGSIARRCGVEEPSSYLRQIFPFIRFSVFLVTLATGLVQFFRMQHLIKDEFHDDGDINFIFSTISAFIAATYSTGTEVLNTYYASKSDHYEVIEIDNETFQPLLTPAFRKEPQGKKMARSTIGFFSRLGASNSAFTESLALHNLMQKATGLWLLHVRLPAVLLF